MLKDYDASRMANFGRDTARAYTAFLRAQERLVLEVNEAIESGISPLKVAHDLLGRCSDREAMVNLMSVISALADMEKIPKSVFEPFKKGIRPRRV